MPTSKGQALADEYGIKFFETVSGNKVSKGNLSMKCLSCVLLTAKEYCSAECKDKYERGGGFLFNCKGY